MALSAWHSGSNGGPIGSAQGATFLFGIDGLTPQIFSTFLLAVLGLVAKLFLGGASNRLYRDLERHAELRSKLADDSEAAGQMDRLLATEVTALTERSTARLNRKLNSGVVAAVILVTVIGGGLFYAFWSLTAAVGQGFWFWVLVVLTALYGLFFLLFMAVGLGKIYDPVSPRSPRVPRAQRS